jgi:hypothetical protein
MKEQRTKKGIREGQNFYAPRKSFTVCSHFEAETTLLTLKIAILGLDRLILGSKIG